MNNKKFIAAIAAGALALGCTIGGTVAWLTSQTQTITNKFTTSDINVTLAETTGAEYQMIPGWFIEKDPVATVVKDSVDCFLFVELEKSEDFDTYMEYTLANGWTVVPGTTDVFYREVAASDVDQPFDVLKVLKTETKDDKTIEYTVKVKDGVTKAQMEALKGKEPTLEVTAYASQKYSSNNTPFAPETAWANVKA